MDSTQTLLADLRAAVSERGVPGPAARAALAAAADPAVLRRAGRLLAGLDPADASLPMARVAILASCTIGSYEHLVRAALVGGGILPVIKLGDYGTFEMTLGSAGFAADGDPDVVAMLMDDSYFLPRDWNAADAEAVAAYVAERLEAFRSVVASATHGSRAMLVAHTIPLRNEVRDTFISWRARARLAQAWHELNAGILGLAAEHAQVAVADLAGILADTAVPASDERMRLYGDMPYTDGAMMVLADQVRRVVQAKMGLSRKVLAIDLDNTLWGGNVGDAGATGVELGGAYPGNCYLALQRAVRRLREQGVILVLASKNDAEVAEAALAEHPEVVLRPEAFSVRAVNWSQKAENLRSAAEALSLPTRSFVFMDDSDFERWHVSNELPEVAIVSAAGEPAHLVHALVRDGWFDVMALTRTDLRRPDLYSTRVVRGEFAAGFSTPEEYLRALNIELEVALASDFTVARLAQLAARTNQFNLTGLRFDEASTAAMVADTRYLVRSFSVSDRFGDEGVVGALWAERGERAWSVLNMVLSCRVLGRGIELAIIGWLAGLARAAGVPLLTGKFVPTGANGAAARFWQQAGFSATGDGNFMLDLRAETQVQTPEWITLRERSGRLCPNVCRSRRLSWTF